MHDVPCCSLDCYFICSLFSHYLRTTLHYHLHCFDLDTLVYQYQYRPHDLSLASVAKLHDCMTIFCIQFEFYLLGLCRASRYLKHQLRSHGARCMFEAGLCQCANFRFFSIAHIGQVLHRSERGSTKIKVHSPLRLGGSLRPDCPSPIR